MSKHEEKGGVTSPEQKSAFEDDTDPIRLPRPTPENVDEDEDEKKAASDDDFDDLVIEVDLDELAAETERDPSRRKF